MKKLILTMLLFTSINSFAQSDGILNRSCNAKISIGLTVIDPRTRAIGPETMVSNWFVDATGPRPQGFFKNGLEKVKYDGVRSILNKGYKLTPSVERTLDVKTSQTDDLLIVMHMVCSADLASAFCSVKPEIFMNMPLSTGPVINRIPYSAARETEGSSDTVIYKTMKTVSKIIDNCIVYPSEEPKKAY